MRHGSIKALGIAISGLAGISGFVFNGLVARIWSPLTLGYVLSAIGLFSAIGIVANMLVLPVARWSAQTPHWNKNVGRRTGLLLAVGMMAGILILLIGRLTLPTIPVGWLITLAMWAVPTPLLAMNTGILLGRRDYKGTTLIASWPAIFRPILLYTMVVLGFHDAIDAILSTTLSQWMASILSIYAIKSREHSNTRDEIPSQSLWISGWVSLSAGLWINLTVVIAQIALSRHALAIFAVCAMLAKIPYHLSTFVRHIDITESNWTTTSLTPSRILIVGLGSIMSLTFYLLSPSINGYFHIHAPPTILIPAGLAMTVIAWIYLETGLDAQKNLHTWWPLAVGWIVWIGLALLTRSLTAMVDTQLAITLLSLAASLGLRKHAMPSFHTLSHAEGE